MQFRTEWESAPGVKDSALAATWARLEILVQGRAVTELVDIQSDSRRIAVFGSVLPLVEWVVENWWFLLHEPCPSSKVPTLGRAEPWMSSTWLRRHGIAAAGGGMPLPDLVISREGDEIILTWGPARALSDSDRVRFISQGQVSLPYQEVEDGLAGLVNQTLARLQHCGVVGEDITRLQADWDAINHSRRTEPQLCRNLAILGVDPYDGEESSEELITTILELEKVLPPGLREDLIEGSTPSTLPSDLEWVRRSRDCLSSNGAVKALRRPVPAVLVVPQAHETGYNLGRWVRDSLLELDPDRAIPNLDVAIEQGLGWKLLVQECPPTKDETRLEGLVGSGPDGRDARVMVPRLRVAAAERFRLARALFFILHGSADSSPRLLSPVSSWLQRASRAFAAELLIPSEAIRRRASGLISLSQAEAMAEEFQVSSFAVRHQIDNHAIGIMES